MNNYKKTTILSVGLITLLSVSNSFAQEAPLPPKGIEKNIKSEPVTKIVTTTPGYMGVVTNITGVTITIKTDQGDIYTVDSSTASINKGSTMITIADIAVGDSIFARGPVTEKVIKATNITNGISLKILEEKADAAAQAQQSKNADQKSSGQKTGFFARILNFFKNLFN